MEKRAVEVLRANVVDLMREHGIPSENALAKAVKLANRDAGVDQKTINNLMRGGAGHAVRIGTIEAIARWAQLPAWALLVEVPSARVLRRLAEVVTRLADQPEADVDVVMTIVRRTDQLMHPRLGNGVSVPVETNGEI